VSARTGEGLVQLRQLLAQAALAARNASDEGEVQDGRDGLRSEPMSLDDYDD
jgi:hypothetical protein